MARIHHALALASVLGITGCLDFGPAASPDGGAGGGTDAFATGFDAPTAALTSLAPAAFGLVDFGNRAPGQLTLRPRLGGWHLGTTGGLLYVEITGNFRIETDLAVGRLGAPDRPPAQPFNVAGLLARAPTQRAGQENWALVARGMMHGVVGIEGKATHDSATETTRRVEGAATGGLRICRLGDDLYLLAHDPEAGWQTALDVPFVVRSDLPATLQVGVFATGWNSLLDTLGEGEPDLEARFDRLAVATPVTPGDCLGE